MPISEAVSNRHDSPSRLSDGEGPGVGLSFQAKSTLPRASDSAGTPQLNGSESQDEDRSTSREQEPMGSERLWSRANGEETNSTESPPGASTTAPDAATPGKPDQDAHGDPSDLTPEGHGEEDQVKGPKGGQLPVSEGGAVVAAGGVSGWSHQALAPHKTEVEGNKHEDEWQDMPAFASYDIYDDNGKLVAREERDSDGEGNAYEGLGGAGKGYTRVQVDEDALSATSMDDNTSYLFKTPGADEATQDEEPRDAPAQLQATKDLLTEAQRIAYVGVTRLALAIMVKELGDVESTKGTKKESKMAMESMKMWSQQMMLRLYAHMDIDTAGTFHDSSANEVCSQFLEQVMIEQLAEHGVQPRDVTPALMKNSHVKNPMAETSSIGIQSPTGSIPNGRESAASLLPEGTENPATSSASPNSEHKDVDIPEVHTPSQLPRTKNIDVDLRWTVLCDLFLVLIADSVYDSRSRVLLERVGAAVDISWLDICRFEKRVTDALEMQESGNKETWDEAEHMENRRKQALKRKYVMMGLATVGGSLVIGLSAGLLAPVIGAGLAAGFTTIGVAGTSGFLAGAGGTALITSGAVVTGGTIAVRASHRRTGAVKTFEYRPLHNNKRVNLIVTISGWMNGKIDDVRLPYSTVDPIMGDIYSVLWEPEMLQSMGATINILATEVGRSPLGAVHVFYIHSHTIGINPRPPASPWQYHSCCSHGLIATSDRLDKALLLDR